MTTALLLSVLAVAQDRPPTVGDTVWLETRIPLAARQILRAQSWDLEEIGQVLGAPTLDLQPDSAVVRYPVAFWFPGQHAVTVPGPIVISPEGRSDTLPGRRLVIEVASVLPTGVRRDTLAPKPAADLIAQTGRSLLPLGMLSLILAAVVGLVGWRLAAARRPRPPAPDPIRPDPDIAALLDRWADAGERRVAADGWTRVLERRAAASGPEAAAAVRPLIEELDRIGFRDDVDPAEVDRAIAAAKGSVLP